MYEYVAILLIRYKYRNYGKIWRLKNMLYIDYRKGLK